MGALTQSFGRCRAVGISRAKKDSKMTENALASKIGETLKIVNFSCFGSSRWHLFNH